MTNLVVNIREKKLFIIDDPIEMDVGSDPNFEFGILLNITENDQPVDYIARADYTDVSLELVTRTRSPNSSSTNVRETTVDLGLER